LIYSKQSNSFMIVAKSPIAEEVKVILSVWREARIGQERAFQELKNGLYVCQIACQNRSFPKTSKN
jgi:hypothetical protein